MALKRFAKLPSLGPHSAFNRVQKNGKRYKGKHMVLVTMPTPNSVTSVGLTVSRKVGGAVERNKVKRRLREIFRLHRALLADHVAYVVISYTTAKNCDIDTLSEDLTLLLKKASRLS